MQFLAALLGGPGIRRRTPILSIRVWLVKTVAGLVPPRVQISPSPPPDGRLVKPGRFLILRGQKPLTIDAYVCYIQLIEGQFPKRQKVIR